jgi:hypothetical protein
MERERKKLEFWWYLGEGDAAAGVRSRGDLPQVRSSSRLPVVHIVEPQILEGLVNVTSSLKSAGSILMLNC